MTENFDYEDEWSENLLEFDEDEDLMYDGGYRDYDSVYINMLKGVVEGESTSEYNSNYS